MNPVNATALYVSASRAVLQCDPREPDTFEEMYKLLPFFRQSLACLVCGNLLEDPISPTHPECQTFVCLACKGQKMQIKTTCNRCKDYCDFQENKQLSLLVECYRKLCLYVTRSPLLQLVRSHVGGSPEVMALLEEVLIPRNQEIEFEHPNPEREDVNLSTPESLTPTEAPPAPAELSAIPQSSSSDPQCFSGAQTFSGEVQGDLSPSSPELEVCELLEEQSHADLPVSVTTCEGFELSLTTEPLAPTPGTVCTLRDGESGSPELEEGEVLLLSVEEVLQTLDPLQPSQASIHIEPETTHTDVTADIAHTQMYIQLDASHNYPQIHADRTNIVTTQDVHIETSSCDRPPVSQSMPNRLYRKRSRSESDREKIKPLSITSLLQNLSSSVNSQNPSSMLHTKLPSASITVPSHTYSSLSNGALPKPNHPIQNHNKGTRKLAEQNPKKPLPKARNVGVSKTKDRSNNQRSSCPVPIRPPHKKPVEKKGCKCGRATQNPSVLTCRGQRCPCYSNRKACLDCICRGCQNSYMANGEKKLEAFAVPEKALEQTRLTLGINLTSFAAAAALRNPAASAIRANTLLNVATAAGTPVTTTFLSASPTPDSNYENSLELLIG